MAEPSARIVHKKLVKKLPPDLRYLGCKNTLAFPWPIKSLT